MSTKQCVNCPGAVDHTTAECPISPERAASSLPAAGSAELPEPDFTLDGGSQPCYYAETVQRIVAALSARQSAHVSVPTDAELVEMARKLGALPELCYAEDHPEIRWRIRPEVRALVRALLNGGEA